MLKLSNCRVSNWTHQLPRWTTSKKKNKSLKKINTSSSLRQGWKNALRRTSVIISSTVTYATFPTHRLRPLSGNWTVKRKLASRTVTSTYTNSFLKRRGNSGSARKKKVMKPLVSYNKEQWRWIKMPESRNSEYSKWSKRYSREMTVKRRCKNMCRHWLLRIKNYRQNCRQNDDLKFNGDITKY